MSWVQFVAVGLGLAFTSALPRSWQQFSLFLMRSGLYSNECPGIEWDNTLSEALCMEQDKKVADLLSIYMAAWSAGGVIAGPFMDHFGPRATCAVGELAQILSMVLLIFSKMNAPLVVFSLVLQGLFCNFVLYTGLMLADYHPHKASIVTAFASSAMAFGSAIPPIILLIWTKLPQYSFKQVFGLYILVIMLPLSLFMVLTSPNIRGGPYKISWFRRNRLEHSLVERTAPAQSLGSNEEPSVLPQVGEDLNAQDVTIHSRPDETNLSLTQIEPGEASPSRSLGRTRSGPTRPESISVDRSSCYVSKNGSMISCKQLPLRDMSVLASVGGSVVERPRMYEKHNKTLFQSMLDLDYILILILSSLPCLAHIYYPAVLRPMSGDAISKFVGWGIMSQGVFCLLFGWLGDRLMSTDMMLIITSMTLIFYVTVLIPNHKLQYFTGTMWIISNSYAFSPRYTACRVFCPPQHLGTLMGFAGAFLGVIELLNLPVARSTNYKACCFSILGLTIFLFLPTLLLRYRESALNKQNQWGIGASFFRASTDLGSFSVMSPKNQNETITPSSHVVLPIATTEVVPPSPEAKPH